MAKIKIFRRGQSTIEDNLHFQEIHTRPSGVYDMVFENISDTAELRRVCITTFAVEIPLAPRNETRSWISVKERLPEYGETVLLARESNQKEKQVIIGHRNSTDASGENWVSMLLPTNKITHWMPLPEPPKEYVEKYVSFLRVPYTSCKGPDGEGPGSRE